MFDALPLLLLKDIQPLLTSEESYRKYKKTK